MRLSVCLGVLLSCVSAAARAQSTPGLPVRLTEAEAIARLSVEHPRVRAQAARIEEIRALQAERVLWPNPTATFARERVLDASDNFLVARQELPITGRRQRLRAAGRAAVEVALADARFQTGLLQAEVRHAYTELLLAQAREGELRAAIEEFRRLIEVLRAREREGEGSQYDRMRGERALLDLETELTLAAGERARAQGDLGALLGLTFAPDTLIAADGLEPLITPPLLADRIEQAVATRADYRSSELSVTQFEAERRAASRLRLPVPTVAGGLKRSSNLIADGAGYQFSVDVSVPLFNHGQAAEAAAAAQKARAEAEAQYRRARIEAEVRTAHTVLVLQQQHAARYREATAAIAEPLARTGRVGYEEGELGILELLDANRQAIDARLRVLELTAAVRSAAIDLDRVTGLEWKP